MLFHAGAAKRLNELGILRKFGAITSVSGGSVLNGILAKAWKDLAWDGAGIAKNFDPLVLAQVQKLASTPAQGRRQNLSKAHVARMSGRFQSM